MDDKLSSFESSMDRLQAIVNELESEQVDLARSVDLYDEGRKLIEHCEKLLAIAEEKLKSSSPSSTRGDTSASSRSDIADDGTALDDEEIPF